MNGGFHVCSLDVTDGGLAAIVRLVNGDLRKALNILQVLLSFSCSGQIGGLWMCCRSLTVEV